MEATTDVWELPASAPRASDTRPRSRSSSRCAHRALHLQGDVVLDPFMGSGTTAVAALRTSRHFVGYDTDSEYVRIAEQRISAERDRLIERRGRPARTTPARRHRAHATWPARCSAGAGSSTSAPSKRPVAGVDVAFTARDRTGRQWLFDFAGAFSTANTGLRRADTLWKALGKAAVIHAAWPEVPFVLLTTAAPARGSAGERAWRSLGEAAPAGGIGAVYDVVELGSSEDEARLRATRRTASRPRWRRRTRPAPRRRTKSRRGATRAR